MKYVPYSPAPTCPNGMLSRTMSTSSPSTTIVVRALCALDGLTESSSSMSESLVRPMMFSCSSTGTAFQAARSCRYFCTIT